MTLTIQLFYDKILFDKYINENADVVLEDFLSVKRRRPDLEEVNDVVQ